MALPETNKNTSFRQFELCQLCKVNHTKRKKHVYSKHHQLILKNILTKFSAKIQSIRQNLFCPAVQDGNFEPGAKFWCYFCKSEYLKHDMLEMTTIVGGGLLEHIASEEHKENMVQFFWDNLLDKKLKPKFVLSLEDLQIAKKAAFLAVKKFQKSKDLERKQLADRLHVAEAERRHRVQLSQSESSTRTTQLSDLSGSRGKATWGKATSGEPSGSGATKRHTLWARGPGLTSIIKDTGSKEAAKEEEEGNVHTGAMPPWMKPETPTNTGEIGPTLADYQKHLERERKAKLPSNRVGAGFDHKTATSADWLPSFGRVWSKGRRLQSKNYFEKEWKWRQPHNKHPHQSGSGTGQSGADNSHSTTASQNHDNGNGPWSNKMTSSEQMGQGAANKRKEQSDIDSQSDVGRPSLPVMPYKRSRGATSDGGRQINLLQTPLLAEQDF